MKREEFWYTNENGLKVFLDWDLAQTRKLSSGNMEGIVQAHCLRISIFMDMETTLEEDDIDELRASARLVEGLEFELQGLWGFEQNKNYHSWWFKVPYCRCPKKENADPIYFGRRIVISNCSIHWREEGDER